MRFRTTLELAGKTATGFRVPAEVVESLGAGKRPPVRVTINGYTYRNTVAVYGDQYLIGVSAQNRAGAAPREVSIPPDFAAALEREPEAKQTFDRLSYSNQQAHVSSIESAKSADTRQRRIEKAIAGSEKATRVEGGIPTDLIKRDYDWSAAIPRLSMPVMIVVGDADGLPPAHAVEVFRAARRRQARRRLGPIGDDQLRLAVLPGLTHYENQVAPGLPQVVIPFLDGA